MPLITVAICTHNRAAILPHAIESVLAQTLSPDDYEILVVDNASTDETPDTVSTFAPRVRYLHEPTLGLSRARNTALAHARGTYLAYLDDDATAHPEWLAALLGGFAHPARPACVGGKVTPVLPVDMPPWLTADLLFCIGALDCAPETFVMNETPHLLHGCNMAFACETLRSLGGFPTHLGRIGTRLLSGEDLWVQHKLRQQKEPCLYTPDAAVSHHIPRARLTRHWFLRRVFWEGITQARLETSERTPRQRAREEWRQLRARGGLRELRTNVTDDARFARKCTEVMALGRIWGFLSPLRRAV